jgi:diphosphomevalonate decarboxylase
LFAIRLGEMELKYAQMKTALANFDFATVQRLTQEDAFSMHAVMQTGTPPACYLTHKTGSLIALFLRYAQEHHLQAFWTLDAGPNIHFLYLSSQNEKMTLFFDSILQDPQHQTAKLYTNQRGHDCLILGK